MAERTAHVVQGLLRQIKTSVFMWNVFPLHPYEEADPFTNRKHTAQEREMSRFAIDWLVNRLSIDVVIAIGRDAELALAEMGITAVSARHPSYGGQRDFARVIQNIYETTQAAEPQLTLF
ncbi:hypothetical protein EN852_029680 [Mesorhizobium sp. M2E.F.Ca.ET.209.01.1.1]|uniref:uracil-DNA glycosylase n=1 Tax=Mesorhizobium sp. M2E.F.Ca.ET.209.01.1.1 TaxID=2500526 RepID=UPI000FD88BFA|nr:uracil-DNA glycosylase [Mesorhizobium sp. M2E.F.Ca.ET.209.01.1.1]TGS09792.1 hypothetical protein EN852_029680 [Mesorhizobium sp. M2E.F.Ca.ET.209.01.1.1]